LVLPEFVIEVVGHRLWFLSVLINLTMMKNLFSTLVIILVLSFSISIISSCHKVTENIAVADAIVGYWRFGETSVEVTVDGVDFVQYATTKFGLTTEEAEDLLDNILDDVLENYAGQIDFNGDRTYEVTLNNDDKESGEWSVSPDGKILNYYFENKKNELVILKLTASLLRVQFPKQYEDVDIDNDGVNETTVEINRTQDITKQIGGAGS